jgi:hypothetical protein
VAAPAGGNAPASGDSAASADTPAEAGSADGTDGAARRTASRRRRKPASQDDAQAAEPVNGTVLEGASEITEAPAATG